MHTHDLRNLPKALDDGSVAARSAPSIYVRAREARPLAVLAQCARSECLHLERAPGARSIGEEFFETTILVIELQKCENTGFHFHAAHFGIQTLRSSALHRVPGSTSSSSPAAVALAVTPRYALRRAPAQPPYTLTA